MTTTRHLQPVDEQPVDEPASALEMAMTPAQCLDAAQMQAVCGHLASERARLEAEARYVAAQEERARASLATWLARSFGLDVHAPGALTIDAARGVITRTAAPPPVSSAPPQGE